jgi:hypothetical protein
MKLTEFIEASKRYRKRLIIRLWLTLFLLFLGIAILTPLQSIIVRYLQPKLGLHEANFIGQLPTLILACSALFWILGCLLYAERKAGLVCPECKKELGQIGGVVIASKCCPHCGKRIIEEDAAGA